MPVRKFRDVSEMEGNTWHEPGSPELLRAIARTWHFAHSTIQPRFPPGIYRHRSIEDANRQREEWEQANFEAYWRRQEEAKRRRGSEPARLDGPDPP